MVKIMENLIKMDDLGGKPTIFGNIHIDSFMVDFSSQENVSFFFFFGDKN